MVMREIRKSIWTIAIIFGLFVVFISSAEAQFVVSGTVTDELLAPIAGVEVFLYNDQDDPIGIPQTLTDGSGFYSISGLPSADYGFEFVPPSPYLIVFETPVSVTSNTTLDIALQIGLILSGTVTDTLGNPLVDIDLNVYDQATGDKLDTPGDNTDGSGFYSVAIPAGTFRIRYRSTVDVIVPLELEYVLITSDTSINVNLMDGYIVSGTVRDDFGDPVFDADLDFSYTTTRVRISTPGDNTDLDGQYSVILPGALLDANVEPLVIDGLAAIDVIGLLITQDTVIDFTVFPGHTISGYVRDISAVGVDRVDIDVKDAITHLKIPTPGDMTDATGFYQMIVPSGTFDISYQPPVAAKLASVTLLAETVTGDRVIDVIVPDGIILSGMVQNGFGQGVVSLDIDVKDAATGVDIPLNGDRTDPTGFFQIVLEPGDYNIELEPPAGRFLAPIKLYGLLLLNDTTINEILDTGLVIDGLITDGGALPIPLVDIEAILSSTGDTVFTPGAITDEFGLYTVLLKPDSYDLIYLPDTASGIADTISFLSVLISNDTTINVSFGGSANQAPVLDPIGPKAILVDQLLQFVVTASDSDGDSLFITTTSLPTTASFVDNTDGTADFSWTPTLGEVGTYNVYFSVIDGQLSDNELVTINVSSTSSNHPPVLNPIGAQYVTAGNLLTFGVSATDQDIDPLVLWAAPLPGSATFLDNSDNTGTFDWSTSVADVGHYILYFAASDGEYSDNETVDIWVSSGDGCCGTYTGGLAGNTNCDVDGKRNLADITRLIDRVYISKLVLCCTENGNVNGSLDGKLNLADITALIDHVYISKAETAGCL